MIAAFGFVEKERWQDDNARLTHRELALGEQVVKLAEPTPDYQSPKTVWAYYPPAANWSECPYIINGVLVQVPDVDAMFERAIGHGAVLLGEMEDGFPASLPGRRPGGPALVLHSSSKVAAIDERRTVPPVPGRSNLKPSIGARLRWYELWGSQCRDFDSFCCLAS